MVLDIQTRLINRFVATISNVLKGPTSRDTDIYINVAEYTLLDVMNNSKCIFALPSGTSAVSTTVQLGFVFINSTTMDKIETTMLFTISFGNNYYLFTQELFCSFV